MPAASYDTVIKDLRSGKFAPLYFLEGEEPYFIDKIADHIEAHALDEAQRDFNQTVLYGKDTSIADVISSAQRYPVFSDRQVVVIREAQHLFSGQGFKEADEKILQSYLENIVPTTILVFCHKYKTLDKRKSISKLIREKAVFVESPKVKENALPEWINRLAHDNGFGIEPRTSQLLAEHLGADLSRIAGEMEKLQLLLPAGSTITDEVVEDHIGISKEFNAFELSDALMKKDFHKCMRILQYFSHNPNAGPMPLIMGSLYNQLSKLYVVLSLPGASDSEIASRAGIPPFLVGVYRSAGKKYNLPRVEAALSLLAEYDVRSKGVNNKGADSHELMREMVYRIMY